MNVIGINVKKLARCEYLDVSSVSKPVPRTDSDPLPICSGINAKSAIRTSSSSLVSNESDFVMEEKHLLSQSELSYLIRDLNLSKQKAEFFVSRLQEWKHLDPKTQFTIYRNRNPAISKKKMTCFCNDAKGLFDVMNTAYDQNEWRLFVDGSKYSLKAALLHIGNKKTIDSDSLRSTN